MEVERITVDELKSKLAKNEAVVVLDVRGRDYDESDSRIKGSLRINPSDIKLQLAEIPRDRDVILFCS